MGYIIQLQKKNSNNLYLICVPSPDPGCKFIIFRAPFYYNTRVSVSYLRDWKCAGLIWNVNYSYLTMSVQVGVSCWHCLCLRNHCILVSGVYFKLHLAIFCPVIIVWLNYGLDSPQSGEVLRTHFYTLLYTIQHCYTQNNMALWHQYTSSYIYNIYIYVSYTLYIVSKCRLLQIALHSCNVYYSAHRSYNRTVLISKYQASQIIHSTV